MAAKKNTVALDILTDLTGYLEDGDNAGAILMEVDWNHSAFQKAYPDLHKALQTSLTALDKAGDLISKYAERDLYSNEDDDNYNEY